MESLEFFRFFCGISLEIYGILLSPKGNTQKNESEEINMFTSLDLLVVVCMGLAAMTLVSIALMFLLKNKTARRVCLYIVAALGVYMSSVAIRIGFDMFIGQVAIGILTGLLSIVAVILECLSKGNEKVLRVSRLMATGALVVGFMNAIL